jgi:hypothetical protein
MINFPSNYLQIPLIEMNSIRYTNLNLELTIFILHIKMIPYLGIIDHSKYLIFSKIHLQYI